MYTHTSSSSKKDLNSLQHCHTYCDIRITIVNEKYSTAVYDKRDDFNFKIVIISKFEYNISRLLRIGRICSNYSDNRATDPSRIPILRFMQVLFYTFAKKQLYNIRKHVEDGICLPAIHSLVAMSHIDGI